MSAHSYVTCLVHRGVVPREEAVCVDHHDANPARRRHVCNRCIASLSLAKHEKQRAIAIASWRATIAEGARAGTSSAGGPQRAS